MSNLQLRDGRVEFRWKRWRNKKRQEVSCCLMVLLSGMVLLGGGGIAEAGPTGGQITGGAGSINYGGTTTTINQKSQVITINWQTFSTARNETVDFNQPGSSSLAINYVVGGVPSVLQGALNADGRVYILNSAGITFTGTSHVNVGALLATTAMTIDGDPTKKIDVKGSGSGQVINQGSIQVSNGGFAILAAPYVENTGFIKADLGTIALAGTNKFTLDLRGDGLINFVVPPEAVEKIKSDGTRVGRQQYRHPAGAFRPGPDLGQRGDPGRERGREHERGGGRQRLCAQRQGRLGADHLRGRHQPHRAGERGRGGLGRRRPDHHQGRGGGQRRRQCRH